MRPNLTLVVWLVAACAADLAVAPKVVDALARTPPSGQHKGQIHGPRRLSGAECRRAGAGDLVASSVNISHIDFTGGYENDESCEWVIRCSDSHADGGGKAAGGGGEGVKDNNAQVVFLRFETFEVEEMWDWVTLYDGAGDAAAPLSVHLSGVLGNTVLAEPYLFAAPSGSMRVMFHSDDDTTAEGFSAAYWCMDLADTVMGCTDSDASNYDPLAQVDDGSCLSACRDGPLAVLGQVCTSNLSLLVFIRIFLTDGLVITARHSSRRFRCSQTKSTTSGTNTVPGRLPARRDTSPSCSSRTSACSSRKIISF